jgi:Ni,Fe-hydrogenase I cytochrome b subunit
MTSLLFLTQKTTYKRQFIYYISKEYNLEIATKKTKVFVFVGTDHRRTKIIKNDETLQQVSLFTYLGCSISYQFSNDVEFKLEKFLQ